MELNPSIVLQRVGVTSYIVNGSEKTVRLSERDFERVARFLDYELTSQSKGFLKGGWYWLKGGN